MRLFVNSRQAAGQVASAALEYCLEVQLVDQSGTESMFCIEFDERGVMNDDEVAALAQKARDLNVAAKVVNIGDYNVEFFGAKPAKQGEDY